MINQLAQHGLPTQGPPGLRFTRIARNDAGSTILTAVIAIAIVSALSVLYANVYASIRQAQTKNDLLNSISQIQLTIANTANDANSWAATLGDSSHNSTMNCIALQNCTTAVGPTEFILWPASESSYTTLTNAVYNGTSASQGFTRTGQPCTTFSLSGNADCPLHVNMTWSTPSCVPGSCQITITADILYRPGPGVSGAALINESRFTLSFIQASNTSNDPCASPAPPAEVSTCLTPPYPADHLICTGTGYVCGQVYR